MTLQEARTTIAAFPQSWNGEPVIILSDSTCLEFESGAEGNLVHFRERTVYFINKQIPDLLETMTVNYNETVERLPHVVIGIRYPDGTKWSHTSSSSEWDRLSAFQGYTSNQFGYAVTLPKYKQGMVVTQIVERTIVRPEFYSKEVIRRAMPIQNRWIRFIAPQQSSIKETLLNNEALSVHKQSETGAGKKVTTCTAANLDKIDEKDICMEPEQCLATWYFSFPPKGTASYSWQQLGDHYLSLIRGSVAGSDRLSTYLEQIKIPQSTASVDSIMNTILLFVRAHIRYHSNADGMYAVVPHPIASIVDNGYGDCKEMSIVCQALAKLKGIPADLVLTNASDEFQPCDSIPTLGAFNHVVIEYKRQNGERLLVDPTRKFGKPLETGFYFQGKKALFIKNKASFYDTIVTPSGFYNSITTKSTVSLNTAAAWELKGTISMCGLTAMMLFESLQSSGMKAQTPLLKHYLKSLFEIDASGLSTVKMTADTVVVSFNSFFQENYLSLSGGGFMIDKPSLFGGDVRFTTVAFSGPRYFPAVEQNDTWNVPKSFGVLEKENLGTEIGKGSWLLQNATISRCFRQNRARVDREKAGEYMRLRAAFSKATIWKSK
jgi:hypothetical protein